LLDIGRCILDNSLIESNNLVAPLIQFEQSVQRREQALVIIQEIDKKFSSKAFDSYRRAMYSYVYRMTRLGKLEPIDFTDLESATMLAQERIKIYDKTLIKQGRTEGLQKGLEKGLQKGLQKGLEKGLQKGRLLATRELAQNMLAAGIDIEQVMKITGLSIDDLQKMV
jgi:predicted transposase/invertase (TIGR01784 family)